MNQKNKKCRLKERQSRNLLIVSLMKETGWKRERVVKAFELMEATQTVCITDDGHLRLRVLGGH